jgi:hypothetical protein
MLPELPPEFLTASPSAHPDEGDDRDGQVSSYQRQLQRLVEIEKECLNHPESGPRCLGPAVAGLKAVVAHYQQGVLGACSDPAAALNLRSELQTYVALLRTVERIENLDLRRAELQKKQQRDPLKLPNTYRSQFRP